MNHTTQLDDVLGDLITINAEGNGSSLSTAARTALESTLVQALINPDQLNEQVRCLQKRLSAQIHHREPLDEATSEAVLHHGLSVLDDVSLVRLALNPIALAALADEIEERQPSGWAEALRSDGLELLRAHGRIIPPLTELRR